VTARGVGRRYAFATSITPRASSAAIASSP
jgi:hypothetical protein